MSEAVELDSEDEDVVIIDEDEEDTKDLGGSWTCQKCQSVNPPFAGDCYDCGEANVQDGCNEPGTSTDHSTATEQAFRVALDQQIKVPEYTGGSVTLDACGCNFSWRRLEEHVHCLVNSPPTEPSLLALHFSCPAESCSASLARRDVVNCIDDETCTMVDQHIYRLLKGEDSKAESAAGTRQVGRPPRKQAKTVSPPLPNAVEEARGLAAAIHAVHKAYGIVEPSASPKSAQRSQNTQPVAKGKNQTASKATAKSAGLAKGTGYGGSESYGSGYGPHQKAAAPSKQLTNARQNQAAADKSVTEALEFVQDRIHQTSGRLEKGVLKSPSMLACAAIFGGPLPFLLMTFLQNDSLMDIGQRADLYVVILRLVQSFARSADLLPIFLRPAVLPVDQSSSDQDNSAPSILDALKTLNIQCQVFKRNAEDLGCADGEIQALSMVLDLNTTYEEVQKAADILLPAQQSLRASLRYHSNTKGKDTGKEGQPQSQKDQKVLEEEYCKALSSFRLKQWPIVTLRDHYFAKQAVTQASNSSYGRKSILRIGQEMSSLSTSLPIAWASSIFVVTDESRLDIIRAMIVGPEGTPYENGIYVFDIFLPPNYPDSPPMVHFLTTGGGQVRFNPNLYNCGKVCLSLLGTWSGPSWDPVHSTLLQVLISIQGMIFIEDPYFNEPGYQQSAGSQQGNAQSEAYNRDIRKQNLNHALLAALMKPPPAFKDLLKIHFTKKRGAILKQIEDWTKRELMLSALAESIRRELEAYVDKPGLVCP